MDDYFIKTDFRFEKYINERLQEISDEGERRALKDIVKETIIPFYEHSEMVYHQLEENLQHNYKDSSNGFGIITGIEYKDKVDITDDAMYPMKYSDISDVTIDVKELKENVSNGKPYKVMQVFLKLDYRDVQMLEKSKRVFHGIVRSEYGEYPAEMFIRKNTSYRNQIEELFYLFETNGIEWKTVCAPYLAKFFDVYIINTKCPENEEIMGISVDFEELKEYIQYDVIPVWNIRFFEESTSSYPSFAFDQIHYEHCIFGNRISDKCDYLVCPQEQKLWEVFRKNGDLHIICDADEPIRWKLMEINYNAKKGNYDSPLFENSDKNIKGMRCIHTKGEITKYIKALNHEDYLKFVDIKPMQMIVGRDRETYCMDEFIEDEIRTSTGRQCMVFKFQAVHREFYLNKDIMSYLVSRIQWQIPEFECIGELE